MGWPMDMAWAGVSQVGGHRQPLAARECGGSRSGLVLSLHEELRTRRGRGNAWYTPGQTLGGSPPRTLWTHPDSLKPPVYPQNHCLIPGDTGSFPTSRPLPRLCALCLGCLSQAILGNAKPLW